MFVVPIYCDTFVLLLIYVDIIIFLARSTAGAITMYVTLILLWDGTAADSHAGHSGTSGPTEGLFAIRGGNESGKSSTRSDRQCISPTNKRVEEECSN